MNRISRRGRLLIRRIIICICFALIPVIFIAGISTCVKALQSGSRAGPVVSQSVQAANVRAAVSHAASRPASAVSQPKPQPKPQSAASAKPEPAPSAKPEPAQPAKPVDWFDDAVFIGDSRTEGLENYDGLGDASYFALKGLMVDTVYTKPAVKLGGQKVPVMQAVKQKKFGKVYIMLGVNELGWSSFQTFVDDYGKMVDDIKKDQPGAKIYLQSILPVTAVKSASSAIYNNLKIRNSNAAIQKLAKQRKVTYLAVDAAVQDSTGALPPTAATDGIHLNADYCAKWCAYLKTHTE